MGQNRSAHGAPAGAASNAPLLPNSEAPAAAPDARLAPAEADDEHAFASEAEEDAYWAGVADGIRNSGGKVPPRLATRAAKQQLLVAIHSEVHDASPTEAPPSGDALAFEPAQLHHRVDGWTPQRQREFVEALADCGIIRQAAARVEMTEQSVNRLRRRAEARGFDLACTAAQRIGARRLLSIAYERAIEGTVKRHYYRGELKAEERVYDNRLLIALLNKLPDAHAPDPEVDAVAANWEPWMDAIEQGLPAPPPPPEQDLEPEPEPEPFDAQVWEDSGDLLTDAPPPADFDDFEEGEPGGHFYQHRLTPAEEDYWHETGEAEASPEYSFGSESHRLGRPTFFPWGSEPSEPSAAAAAPEAERSEASKASGKSRPGPDGGSAPAEPGRRHGSAATPESNQP